MVQDWILVIQDSLTALWEQVLSFLPSLIGAILILIVGLIVASILERISERILYYLRIDSALKKLGAHTYMERANINLNTGHFIGRFVYWFVVIAFVLAASDILGFYALSTFLGAVLFYIPNVIVAALILLVALVAASFVRRLVVASINSAKLHHADGIGTLAWWVIFVFGFLAALQQLGIAETIITAIISGFVAMLALAGGLAFGLGGRDSAKKFLDDLGRGMK
jgi:hypothetical protein